MSSHSARTDDPEAIDAAPPTSAATLAGAAASAGVDATAIVMLDGTQLDEADLSELA